jgi:Arylsulfotransferase (ASST)
LAVGVGRREFLRRAGGVAGGLVLSGSGLARAAGTRSEAAAAALEARRGGTITHGVQHFRSRPDLRPPEIVIDVPAHNVAPGAIFTDASSTPTEQGAMIMNGRGELVWYRPVSKGRSFHRAFNLRVGEYRGAPVLSWFVGAVLFGHGYGHYEIHDQQYRQVAEVHAHNGYKSDLHEFLLTPEGTALFTCYGRGTGYLAADSGARQGEYFYGVVQEVDVATGELLFQWRSDHHVPFNASYQDLPSPPEAWDYFHINSIAIDPSDGHLLISSRNTWACYKVHRRTGRVLWKLGGKGGDFKMGAGTHFAFQHHVWLHPGGVLTIFDNEAGPPDEASQSRGLVLQLNQRTRRVRFIRQFVHRPPVLSVALGSVQPLGHGHTLMGWGASGYVTEYGPGGTVLFDAHLRSSSSYRAFKQDWAATPAQPPDLAVTRSGATATLYASWNGATEVTRWRVLGGPGMQQLTPLGVAPRHGFETAITVRQAPAVLAVQALDASGGMLAASRAVQGSGRS